MDANVKSLIESYPNPARDYLMQIRELIYDIAENESLGAITETLKWGEPSYASKKGSPIRMDWKAKNPESVSIFFNCKTTLVETFRELHANALQLNGNREIIISTAEPLPVDELRSCLVMALRYHDLKKLPLLGA